jgi:hypothetical protein
MSFDITWAVIRAMMSVGPPAGQGTMIVILFAG